MAIMIFTGVDNVSDIFSLHLQRGTIDLDDIRTLREEELMSKILDNVHRYNITHGHDGRWSTYIPDASKSDGRRKVTKKSRRDLYAYLLEFYNLNSSSNRLKFSEVYTEWVEYKRQFVGASNRKRSLSPSTIRRYERDFNNYIKSTDLARTLVCELTTPKLEREITAIIKKHDLNEKCAGNIIGYICQAMRYARRSDYISRDPAENVDRQLLLSTCRFVPPKDSSERVLTIEEFHALYKEVLMQQRKYPYYMPNYAIELAMLTGMRVGEIAALHWKDIDNDFIRIDYSEHRLDYSDRPSELEIGEPKNGRHRVIQMTDEIKGVFAKVNALGMDCPDDFIFVRKDKSRYTGHDISCAVARRAANAGVKKTSIHGIRRTVSSMLNTILPQKAVADLLGHTERVNEQHYNYSIVENAEKKRALEEVFSKVLKFEDYSSKNKTATNA